MMTGPARFLAAVADALNTLERAGIIADLEHGAVLTRCGYILPAGHGRLGSRWQVRARLQPPLSPEGESSGED